MAEQCAATETLSVCEQDTEIDEKYIKKYYTFLIFEAKHDEEWNRNVHTETQRYEMCVCVDIIKQ